jgi:uncharacterized protein YjbI with pentapeptide repeats
MANEKHLAILKKGIEAWNKWREENPKIRPDLSKSDLSVMDFGGANIRCANLSGVDLSEANLSGVDLSEANLSGVDLRCADLRWANLSKADLHKADLRNSSFFSANVSKASFFVADLSWTDLSESDLRGANLTAANLCGVNFKRADIRSANFQHAYLANAIFCDAFLHSANFSHASLFNSDLRHADLREVNFTAANLRDANLSEAILIDTNFENATLDGCNIFGISAWKLRLDGAKQSDLLITDVNEPAITVDNLEVAQFIYLLLNNQKIRQVIDTITSKVVLILGRFSSERKPVLLAVREKIRQYGYLPILFDFEKPVSRDLTETISTLAHMAKFVIADITDAKSIPQELERIVPGLPSVPVQPLLLASQKEYEMFEHISRYPWVLNPVLYEDQEKLLMEIETKVIAPAEAKARDLKQEDKKEASKRTSKRARP